MTPACPASILIVDADQEWTEEVKGSLKRHGFVIQPPTTMAEIVSAIKSTAMDLVIHDSNLPELSKRLDGLEQLKSWAMSRQ